MINSSVNKNIILNQVFKEGEKIFFKEVFPFLPEIPLPLVLNLDTTGKLYWAPLPVPEKTNLQSGENVILSKTPSGSLRIDVSIYNPFKEIFFIKDNRIGLGREPLLTYFFDIAIPENTIMTAFHIGDGKRGFSMGNGTNNGFLPEIIGMGKTEQDAGFYILGRAGNAKPSDIPLIILDGRNSEDSYLVNRPILGITSAEYNTYHLIIDYDGKMGLGRKPERYKFEVNGEISASDFILEGLSIKSLVNIISEQQNEINRIKNLIKQIFDKK